MMKNLLLGLMLILAITSCSKKITGNSVNDTKWVLTEWPTKTLPIGKEATLSFDAEHKISGKSFCNGFGGNAIIKSNTIKFDQVFGTMMYCEEVGQAEKIYLDDLKATNAFKVVGNKLHLFKDDQLLMVFTKSL